MLINIKKIDQFTKALITSSILMIPLDTISAEIDINAANVAVATGESFFFSTKNPNYQADIANGANIPAGDGINVPILQSIAVTTNATGVINFLGDSTINKAIGTNLLKPANITMAGANSTITIEDKAFLSNNLTYGNTNQTVIIKNNLTLDNIDFLKNSDNILTLDATANPVTLTGTINNTGTVGKGIIKTVGTKATAITGAISNIDAIQLGTGAGDTGLLFLNGPTTLTNNIIFGQDTQTVILTDNTTLNKVEFNNKNATLSITGDNKTLTGAIDTITAPSGTIEFSSSHGNITTVTGKIGQTQPINRITINDVNASLTGVGGVGGFKATTIKFANINSILTLPNDTQLGDGAGTGSLTATANGNGTINFTESGQITAGTTIGAAGNALGTINLDSHNAGGKTLEFTTAPVGGIHVNNINIISTAVDSTVKFTGANNIITSTIKTNTDHLNIIDFSNTANIIGNVGETEKYFKQIKVAQNNNIVLNGNIWTDNFSFQGNNTVTVADGHSIHAPLISTKTNGQGTLNFNGDYNTEGTIGQNTPLSLAAININGTLKTLNTGHNIYANIINVNGKNTLKTTANNLTLSGNVNTSGTGSIINIESNTLNINGSLTTKATDNIYLNFNGVTTGTIILDAAGGGATIDAGTILNVDTDTATGFLRSKTYDIIIDKTGNNNIANLNPENIIERNSSAIFSLSSKVQLIDTSRILQLTLTRANLNEPQFNIGPSSEALQNNFNNAVNSGQLTPALEFISRQINALDTNEEVKTAFETMTPTDVANAVATATIQIIDTHIDSINGHLNNVHAGLHQYNTGLNAGDNVNDMGLWARLTKSDFNQKIHQQVKGYNGNNIALMFGVDTHISNTLLMGMSLGLGNSDIEYELAKNQLNIDSLQGTLYASYNSDNPWFVNTILGLSHHKYDQRRNIIIGPAISTAMARYSAWEYLANIRLNYEYQKGNWFITPSSDLKYVHLDIGDYNETNAGTLNLSVKNKNIDAFIVGAGLKTEYRHHTLAQIFSPEIHANVYYDFNSKRQETNNIFSGSPLTFTANGFKPPHVSFELGAGLNLYSSNNIIFNLHYNYAFKEDFFSHNGLLKLKYTW